MLILSKTTKIFKKKNKSLTKIILNMV